MKNLLLLIIFLVAIFQGFEHYKKSDAKTQNTPPLYNHPYLVVYGKDSCGFTQQTIKNLTESGVQFEYMPLEDAGVKQSLVLRMQAKGIDTSHYLLPVIDLNNSFEFQPDDAELIKKAKASSL